MSKLDDHDLLARYARDNSEAAFAALAERHVNLVYSTAFRSVGNAHAAGDISQAVFIILANKAETLAKARRGVAATVLSGWLYQTTRLTAANFLRGEIRRQKREQEAYMQSTLQESADEESAWRQIAPLLDDALGKLGERDRNAIVLRFFENKNLREVGLATGVSEDAAKMRVNRTLEKLRKFFGKRGAALSITAIAGAVSANSVQAAPAGLAKAISVVALAKGAAAGGSTMALVKGALKLMAWTKAKTTLVVGLSVLLVAGTTTVAVKEIQNHRIYPWQVEGFNSSILDKQPPQVRILPSKVKFGAYGTSWDKNGQIKMMGTGVSAQEVVEAACSFYKPSRTVFSAELPQGRYDYISCLSENNQDALQLAVKKKFDVVAKQQTQDVDVLVLKIQNPGASGLKPSHTNPNNGSTTRNDRLGNWSCKNSPISGLADYLEECTKTPVINKTGLTGNYDIDLKWPQSNWGKMYSDGLKEALANQLGLELVPSRQPVEMLVVEKAK